MSKLSFNPKLTGIKGKHSEHYFNRVFQLFPEKLQPEGRKTFKAYDGINNVFNFGYYMLECRVDKALLRAETRAS